MSLENFRESNVNSVHQELMVRFQSGDEEAFNELYVQTHKALLALALKRTRNDHDAEELVQEAFLRIFKSKDTYDSDKSFLSWAYRIVSNVASDRQRKRNRRLVVDNACDIDWVVPIMDDFREPDPLSAVIKDELRRRVRSAVSWLTPAAKEAVELCSIQEMSLQDAMRILSINERALRTRLADGKKQLRQNGNLNTYKNQSPRVAIEQILEQGAGASLECVTSASDDGRSRE